MRISYLVLPAILFPLCMYSVSYPADVVRVVDGDTVILEWNGQQGRVRIIGIDTPEIVAQNRPVECFGSEASGYAKSLLPQHSQVQFEFDLERDKYNRALGYITLPSGQDFGQVMIAEGYAYAYRSFDHDRMGSYTAAESRARLNKQGLWADDACRTAPQSVEQTISAWQQYIAYIKTFSQIIKQLFDIFS